MQAPGRAKPSRGGDRMGQRRKAQPMHPERSGPGEAPAIGQPGADQKVRQTGLIRMHPLGRIQRGE